MEKSKTPAYRLLYAFSMLDLSPLWQAHQNHKTTRSRSSLLLEPCRWFLFDLDRVETTRDRRLNRILTGIPDFALFLVVVFVLSGIHKTLAPSG